MINQHKQSRINMVNSQLLTSGIVDEDLIDSYRTVPRERFCPKDVAPYCYVDSCLRIDSDGRYLLAPLLHAKMVQALDIKKSDIVLDVGGGTGFSAAIISSLASTVVVLDCNQGYLDSAVRIYNELGLCNIIQHKAELCDGCDHYGPYNAIIVNGALRQTPEKIISQLAIGGRLIYVHQEGEYKLGEIRLITRLSESEVSSDVFCTAKAPFLEPEQAKKSFNF